MLSENAHVHHPYYNILLLLKQETEASIFIFLLAYRTIFQLNFLLILWNVPLKMLLNIYGLRRNIWDIYCCCSVAKSCSALRSHELQHTRLPCRSPSPRASSDSHPLSWWCYLTISSSATPVFCLQSLSASGSFPMSQLPNRWKSIYSSLSFSNSSSNEYSGLISFRIHWFDLLSVQALKNKNLHSITIAPSSSMNLSLLATSLLLATKRNTDGQNNKSLWLPMVATTMLTSPLRRAWQGTRQEKYTIRLGTQIHHSLQGIGPISLFQSFFWVF